MAFGFQKTVTAVTELDRQIDLIILSFPQDQNKAAELFEVYRQFQ
jgi:hypothetical protein